MFYIFFAISTGREMKVFSMIRLVVQQYQDHMMDQD